MNQNKNEITEDTLLRLADTMASAASSFSSHGYDQFLEARENFKSVSLHIFNTYVRHNNTRKIIAANNEK